MEPFPLIFFNKNPTVYLEQGQSGMNCTSELDKLH